MIHTLVRSPVTSFLCITAAISTTMGLVAFSIGGRDTFENPRALPFLLVTIWAPNLAAITLLMLSGRTTTLLSLLKTGASLGAWGLSLLPFFVAILLGLHTGLRSPITASGMLLLVGINLAMGPLGEELGWRGFLLPTLLQRYEPALAALWVGLAWGLWHLPLWFLPSPHRAIPFPVFLTTVLCFSVLMTAMWRLSPGSIGPAIVFHLTANLGITWLEATGTLSAAAAYRKGLWLYGPAALAALAWLLYAPPPSPASPTGPAGPSYFGATGQHTDQPYTDQP